MALTGLFLCSFLLVHLYGNSNLFGDPQNAKPAFDTFAKFMSTFPPMRILEAGLFLGFFLHILQGVILYFQNRQARPIPYAKKPGNETSSPLSRIMIWSGGLVFFFLVVHVNTFFVNVRLRLGHEVSMYDAVKSAFENPVYSAFYLVALLFLGLHLNHGFESAFQTLGLNHKKYTPLIKVLGLLYSVLVPLGFAAMPVYFLYLKFICASGGH
jgi:succinate dehydrogenase / fumarate reductase cytochrome b subunit